MSQAAFGESSPWSVGVEEELMILDAKAIQQLLKEVDMKDVGLALKGANEDIKQMIFSNMSQRAAQMLQEDMEFMGPVKRRSVEEAQGRIVASETPT